MKVKRGMPPPGGRLMQEHHIRKRKAVKVVVFLSHPFQNLCERFLLHWAQFGKRLKVPPRKDVDFIRPARIERNKSTELLVFSNHPAAVAAFLFQNLAV